MPHLHLSLQSGDDMILKRMKRGIRAGTPSTSVRRCGGCGRTSPSVPTSSPAFRPRPTTCSRDRSILSRTAISPSCMCFHTRRARVRRRRGCHRSQATYQGSRQAIARRGRRGAATAACCGGWRDAPRVDRKRHPGPDRAFCAGRDCGEDGRRVEPDDCRARWCATARVRTGSAIGVACYGTRPVQDRGVLPAGTEPGWRGAIDLVGLRQAGRCRYNQWPVAVADR